MKTQRLLGLAVAFLVLMLANRSHAVSDRFYSGAACNDSGQSSSNSSRVYGETCGANTMATSYGCPIVAWTSANPSTTKAELYYQDNSTTGPIQCDVEGTTTNGTQYITSSKFSCSTSGGCTTNSGPSYTGNNYFHWDNPLNSGNSFTAAGMEIGCNVPAGSTNSCIMGYYMQTSP